MITIDKGSENLVYSGICFKCRHFNSDVFIYSGKHSCLAFDEIPMEIWNEKNDHQLPYPGDGGIMFEPIADEDDTETDSV